MVSAWRNFKNIFSRPLFTIIFRPEMLKFHPYSILTGDTRVEFVIYWIFQNLISGRFKHGLLNGIVGLVTWQQQLVYSTFKDGIMHGPAIAYGTVPIMNPEVCFIH